MKNKWLALATIVTGLAHPRLVQADAPEQLPKPDHAAIERAAQRIESGRDYAADLPERLRECTATANPYAHSGITSEMVESKLIRITCLRAMLRKLGELYFVPGAFGPGGIDTRIDEIAKPLYTIYHDVHNRGVFHDGGKSVSYCDGGSCGSISEQLLPRDDYVDFLMDLARYVAGYDADIDERRRNWNEAWIEAAKFE